VPTTTKLVVLTVTKSGRSVLADAVGYLACPLCGGDLLTFDNTLRCAGGHSFDVARAGYASLLAGDAHTGTADTAAMAEARDVFLGAGHYASIATAVTDAVVSVAGDTPGCIVDVGAGTGYYLARALDRLPERVGLALDISKHATRRAARVHARAAAAVCDAWRALPVRTGAASAVLNIFAPRNAVEFQRILQPGGLLVVVTPTARHLRELVGPLGLLKVDEDKAQRLEEQLGSRFERVAAVAVEGAMMLTHEDASAVAGMGPSAWHSDEASLQARVGELAEPVHATLSVTVGSYRVL
jgi:23S rRNA (guanine745-N1)-methyltransferase